MHATTETGVVYVSSQIQRKSIIFKTFFVYLLFSWGVKSVSET